MTPVRLAALVGVAVLVLVINVAMSVLYMVIYGYLINPGHPKEFYDEHIKVAAPYCSIAAGIPLFFLAALWVAGWSGSPGASATLGMKAALAVWLAYAVIDLAIVLAASGSGMSAKMAVLVATSLVTKLAATYAGAALSLHLASQSVPPPQP